MSLDNNTKKFRDKSKKKRKFNTKKLQYGSLSLVLTIAFIAIILFANAGVTYLTDRYSLKADISAAGYYEISEQTEIMLKNLTEPVTCYILLSEAEVQSSSAYSIAAEFLQRYENLSDGNFTVEYVDVYKNPTFMNQFDGDETPSTGSFIMSSSKRYRVCSLYDLYDVTTTYDDYGNVDASYVSGFNADETFASMLHYVSTGELPTVVFLNGHGESYGDSFKEIFEENNYEIKELSLLMEDIPAGTDLVVMGGAYTDYTEEELEKIDSYLMDDFGSMMVFMAFDADPLPNLEAYFTEWGVEFTTQLVLDSKRALTFQPMIVPNIKSTDLSDTMTYSTTSYVCSPYSRAINILWDEKSSRTTSAELVSSDTSYAKDYSQDEQISTFQQEDGDAVGPFNVAVLSQYWQWINNRSYYGKILFFGSSSITADSMLDADALYNKKYITSAISYLTPTSDAVSLTARDLTSTQMAVLEEQATAILIALVIVLPVLIMALGVVVWLKRRNK